MVSVLFRRRTGTGGSGERPCSIGMDTAGSRVHQELRHGVPGAFLPARWAGRSGAGITATGAAKPPGAPHQYRTPAHRPGVCLSPLRQTPSTGANCATLAADRPARRAAIEPADSALVSGIGVIRIQRPGGSDLSLLLRHRQPAHVPLVGHTRCHVHASSLLSSSRAEDPRE